MSLKIRLLVLATGLLPGMAGCSTHQRPVQIDSPTQVRHVEQESPSSFTATKSTGEVISEDEFNSTESIDWAVMREPDQSPLDTDIPDFDVEIQTVQAEIESVTEEISFDSLEQLESQALAANPGIHRLQNEVRASWAKVPQAEALPDPTAGANVFGHPIETAAGSQRANFQISQMIPWLDRLEAQSQQAAFEALAVQQMLEAEKLRVITDVRVNYYRLYVINKQLEVNRRNQELLQNLIETANSRVGVGAGTQSDVLLGTLQLSRLEEELVSLKQQRSSTLAVINKTLNRPVDSEVETPQSLTLAYPGWTHEALQRLAYQYQPEIAMSTLQERATRWGIEVATLKRRPDFSINANYFLIDDNRPATNVVNVGEDAWSLGAAVTIPLWDRKYDAIEEEATRKHYAAHFKTEEIRLKYEALLLDFTAKARAAEETADIYEATILPQARQTLDADLQSYAQGTVEFDRVIQDFRNLLTLELGYHRAMGELGMALSLINQAVGRDVRTVEPLELPPAE